MVSFLSISISPPSTTTPFYSVRSLSPLPRLSRSSTTQFKKLVILPLRCSSGPTNNTEPEPDTTSSSLASTSNSDGSISTYNWCAGIGALGFLETGYLTYLKLTDSDAFCPIGGGNCADILNSDYASILGIPLPLVGMVAYGLVAAVSLQINRKDSPLGLDKANGRLILLGTTTSMATASAYFLYLLSTKFSGSSCSYCLLSATLSFTLFFTILKDFGVQEIQKVVGLQLFIAGLVIASLNISYSAIQPVSTNLADINLPFYQTEITTKSSPLAISLAKHLRSVGAKMYGAFWCSHCLEQKQMFGQEAAKILDYVECFPDGFKKGTQIAKACADAGLQGFPSWVINGKVLSGQQEFSELAEASGFVLEEFKPS